MVNMCLLPEVDVSQSVTKIYANFIKWSVRNFCHLQGVLLNFGFVLVCKGHSLCNVLSDVFIHSFPIILSFDQAVCTIVSLVSQFIMCFH